MKLLSTLAALLLANAAMATVPVTAAYSKLFDYGLNANDNGAVMTTDKSNNLYVSGTAHMYEYPVWFVDKYDPYGNLLWRNSMPMQGNASSPNVMTVDGTGKLWVAGGTAGGVTAMEFLPTGAVGWVRLIQSFSGGLNWPLAITHDGVGNCRIAFGDHVSGKSGLVVDTIDPKGLITNSLSDANDFPGAATFNPQGYLAMTGRENVGSQPEFVIMDPQYNVVKQETADQSGGTLYSFGIAADPGTHFYIATNLTGMSNTYAHTIRCFGQDGSLAWSSSNLEAGSVSGLAASDPSHVYSASGDFKGFNVSLETPAGFAWSKPVTGSGMVADGANGVVIEQATKDAVPIYSLQKLDALGNILWNANINAPNQYLGIQSGGFLVSNGSVVFISEAQKAGLTWDIVLDKFVSGAALASVSVHPVAVIGGQPVTGVVQMNVPQLATPVISLACSNPYLVSIPASVTVARGMLTANFQGVTEPVDTQTLIQFTARSLGVQRSNGIYLLPAPLSSLTLSASTAKVGTIVTGTVTLNGVTGIQGRTVTLKSSDNNLAVVQASVFIPPNSPSATFPVKTVAGGNGTVTISATAIGVTQTKTLKVTP